MCRGASVAQRLREPNRVEGAETSGFGAWSKCCHVSIHNLWAYVLSKMTSNHQALPLCLRALIPQTRVGHSAPGSSFGILIPQLPQPLSEIILGHEFYLQGIKPWP